LDTETDPVHQTLCFLVISDSGLWIKSRNRVILGVMHYRQKPFGSISEPTLKSVLVYFVSLT
jgi:hypothetical protein